MNIEQGQENLMNQDKAGISLPPGNRQILVPLFDKFIPLGGCVAATLDRMGEARVDDIQNPTVGYLFYSWANMFSGDSTNPIARKLVENIPPKTDLIGETPEWEELFLDVWEPEMVEKYTRYAFGPGQWSDNKRENIRSFVNEIDENDKYSIEKITTLAEIGELRQVQAWLVNNYPDDYFLENGIGFVAKHEGKVVSGCTNYASGHGSIEIGIGTAEDHKRKGLAKAVGAKMILYCLENEIIPRWDAANLESVNLAKILGYPDAIPYNVYAINQNGND